MRSVLLFSTLALAAGFGCYQGPKVDVNKAPSSNGTDTDATEPTDGTTPPPASGAAGLPCDVKAFLDENCNDCHGDKLASGVPNHLLTYADLAAPSDDDPSKTMADVSLARIKATKRPMPPDGALAPSDYKVFADWVAAGLPKGSCAAPSSPDAPPSSSSSATPPPPPPRDAGASSGSTPPPSTSPVCTSGQTWSGGTGSAMRPGEACLDCHDGSTNAKTLSVAGTIFPTAHEPDDCNGVDFTTTPATLTLIDANGASRTVTMGPAGNFYRVTSIALPYTAKLTIGGRTTTMTTPQTNTNCNSCHDGKAGGPGRIH